MCNWKVKTSNETKEEMVERFSLRVTTPSRAYEPVQEVETDSGRFWSTIRISQLLLVGDFVNGELPYFSKSKRQGQGLSTLRYLFSSSFISSCFQHSSCRINSTAALRGTFILELMSQSIDGPFL